MKTQRIIYRYILKYRMLIFFVISCGLLILFPLAQHLDIVPVTGIELFTNILLLFGIYHVSPNRHLFAVSVFISLLAIVVIWSAKFFSSKNQLLFGLFIETILFMIAIFYIVLHVLTMKKINIDKIFGAISAYLLLCILWALIYTMIEIYYPSSFLFDTGYVTSSSSLSVHGFYFTQFLYLSFVSFSTLGFGDIVPLTTLARMASSLEAVAGQLYVAILISRLVGLHIIESQKKLKM